MNNKEKIKKIEKELEHLARIDNKFKELGKFLYKAWSGEKYYNFEAIMRVFDRELKELKK